MEGMYFLYVFVGFSVLMGQPLIVLVVGVITGYSYIVVADAVRDRWGVEVLRPPAFL